MSIRATLALVLIPILYLVVAFIESPVFDALMSIQ
jgi:hypothetical protein